MSNRTPHHRSEDDQFELLLAEEALLLEAQMLIQRVLTDAKLSQRDLATRMGVGESYVSQMLGLSGRNLTLKTIARAMHALQAKVVIRLETDIATEVEVQVADSSVDAVRELDAETATGIDGWSSSEEIGDVEAATGSLNCLVDQLDSVAFAAAIRAVSAADPLIWCGGRSHRQSSGGRTRGSHKYDADAYAAYDPLYLKAA